jgi:hypothetical protein
MSDATDAVAEALARNRHLAATHLVRKQDLEAELEKLRASEPVDETRVGALTTELLAATQNYKDAMAELAALDKLGAKARQVDARVIAASVLSPDPLIRSAEQIALDNVRERASSMDAMDRLNQELGEKPAAPKPAAKPTREEADAAARSEFEALRARSQSPAAPSNRDDPPAPSPEAPPKKTL